MYTIHIEVIRSTHVKHLDNTDRIFYLAQEWLKQPKTRSVRVENPDGKVVFFWSRYLHA